MATTGEFKDALKRMLGQNGALNRIEAQAKSEVFSALDKSAPSGVAVTDGCYEEENFLINELILEYLRFNKYVCIIVNTNYLTYCACCVEHTGSATFL